MKYLLILPVILFCSCQKTHCWECNWGGYLNNVDTFCNVKKGDIEGIMKGYEHDCRKLK